jgi:hypothetical protein
MTIPQVELQVAQPAQRAIIRNLVSNAVKTPAGEVRVSA